MTMARFFILVSLLLSFNRCRAQEDPVVARTVNATDRAAFIYSGEWRQGGGTCEGGVLTSTPGSSVSFRFTGKDPSFILHGVSEKQSASLNITLDGVPVSFPLPSSTSPDCGSESVHLTLPSGGVIDPTMEHLLSVTLEEPVAPQQKNTIVLFSVSFLPPSEVASSSDTVSSPVPSSTSQQVASSSSTSILQQAMTAFDVASSPVVSTLASSSQPVAAPLSTAITARTDTDETSLSAGAITGIVVGALAVLVIGISALLCTRRYDRQHEAPNMLSNQDLERIADRAVNIAFPVTPTKPGEIHVVLPFPYSYGEPTLEKKAPPMYAAATPPRRSVLGFVRKVRGQPQQSASQQPESFLPLYTPPKYKASSSPTISTNDKASLAPPPPLLPIPRLSVSSPITGYSPARDHPDGTGLNILPERRPSYVQDMRPVHLDVHLDVPPRTPQAPLRKTSFGLRSGWFI